jgi:hypothetical protein
MSPSSEAQPVYIVDSDLSLFCTSLPLANANCIANASICIFFPRKIIATRRISLAAPDSTRDPIYLSISNLALQQIPNNLPSCNPRRMPQGGNIQGTKEPIRKPKRHHQRNPALRQLQSPASLMHLILFDSSSLQMMHASLWIALHDKTVRRSSPLFPFQDVEIVVRGMTARMPFRSQRCAEDDEVFCYGGVEDVHGAHCSTGVVEEPFRLVGAYLCTRVPYCIR